jgi:hypothetical protein
MSDAIPQIPVNQKRAGIGASVVSGIGGMISGGLGMALVGGALAAAVAGVAALIIPGGLELVQSTVKAAFPTLAAKATAGAAGAIGYAAAAGAIALGAIGTALGGIAGVIKSREIGRPSIEDIAKTAFAQGVAVGHAIEAQEQALAQESTKFREMVGKPQPQQESFRERVEVQAAQAIGIPGKLH